MDKDTLLKTSEEFTDSLNDNKRELMQGMSETSGLTYGQIQQLNRACHSSRPAFRRSDPSAAAASRMGN
jgi:hypothetical protein